MRWGCRHAPYCFFFFYRTSGVRVLAVSTHGYILEILWFYHFSTDVVLLEEDSSSGFTAVTKLSSTYIHNWYRCTEYSNPTPRPDPGISTGASLVINTWIQCKYRVSQNNTHTSGGKNCRNIWKKDEYKLPLQVSICIEVLLFMQVLLFLMCVCSVWSVTF